MDALQDHPIASIFPLLSEPELAELAEDIKWNGVKVPIVLYQGKILDGRNRYRAAKMVGAYLPPCDHYDGETPTSHVISLNLKRRHLTPSQASAAAVESLPFFEAEAKKRQGARTDIHQKVDGCSKGQAAEKAAEAFKTNRQYVSDAKKLKANAPALFEEVRNGKKTITEAKREIRKSEHKAKVEAAAKAPKRKEISGPFDLIVADPPWQYDDALPNRAIENHYPTATPAEIAKHAPDAKPDSVLFLWATAPKLVEALAVMSEWGFGYRTHAVWDKETVGMGYWFRGQHELLLVGTKGKPGTTPECERVSSVFRSPRGKHSTKPEAVYAWIERAFPDAVKLEMYCRAPREGWAAWGNEV